MWAPLSVKHEFPEQLPLPETSPIADGNGDLVESHRLINLERSSLLMVKPEMASTLPGGNEPFVCQEASPLSAQAFTGSKNLDDLPPSPPPLPWVSESTTVPEESEYKNRDPLVSDTRDSETPAPPEIRTKGTSPGCLKNTIPVSVYAGGEVQFNHMGVAYSISPYVTYLCTERTTFKDVTDEIYKVLKLSEDLVSLNIQARYNAVSTGPFFFTLLAINDDKAWRLIYEMAVSGMNWRIIELYVKFVPNQACQHYNSNPTSSGSTRSVTQQSMPMHVIPSPIPRNFPIESSRTQQNTPMHAKPSQTKPKPPLPLISELTMLESECDIVNPVTQSPRTVHETPDQLTKACQPDVSMIPLVSGTTDTGPTGNEQMEVSQIDTNKDDEVAISDRPPTEMAPPGSDTRDSETPTPLAMRILVTPSETDMKRNSHVLKANNGGRKIQKGKGKAKVPSDAECYYCKNKGHWKRNCRLYLADLKAGNVPISSGIFVSNVPSDAKPSQTKPKPPLPLISELMMQSECDNVNPVTQSPRTVHETPDQLTKVCQPDVSMIPPVSATTDDEQIEVSQIDTNKNDEVAISDRPPTEMAPPGSDMRDSETPAPLAMRILVTPSETDMKKGNSHVLKVSNGERKIQKGKGKAKAKGGKGIGNDIGKGKAPVEATSASRRKVPSDAECYYCKNKGHWKRNCPLYLADLKAGNVPTSSGIFVSNVPSDVECCYCKNKGHWKRNCPLYLADLKALEMFRSRQVEASGF